MPSAMTSLQKLPVAIFVGFSVAIFYAFYRLAALILLNFQRGSFKFKHGCKPLQRRIRHKDPILGLDFVRTNIKASREKKFLETLCARYRDVGTTYEVKIFGTYGILTIEPENIKTILSVRFQDYSLGNRPGIMGALLGKGIFTTDGKDWAHSRAMLRPDFVKEQVGDLQVFESHVQDLFKLIPRDGSTIDLQPLFFRFTLDSATEFLFGHSVHSLRQSEAADQRFGEAFNYSLGELALRFRLGPLRRFRRNKKADEAFATCRAYVDQFVEEAVRYRKNSAVRDPEKTSKKNLFLQELAKAFDNKDRIRDELLNILIAGRDTTASLLSHAIFEISRRPEVWKKLQREIAPLNGRVPNYEQLKNMRWLKNCVLETLRLHPPVPTNTRLCVKDTVLPVGGGRFGEDPIFVPKGCVMIYTVHAMHRRKDLFGEDAEEFRPERWETQRHSWEYLPFNGGPRICLGQQYAITETSYVLIRMLQEYKTVESRDSKPWTESLTLTVCSENGVQVGVTPA